MPEMLMNWLSILGLFYSLGFVAVNVGFAAAVARDAGEFTRRNGQTELAPSQLWVAATLLGGVFVATLYWLVHYSALSRR